MSALGHMVLIAFCFRKKETKLSKMKRKWKKISITKKLNNKTKVTQENKQKIKTKIKIIQFSATVL